MLGLYFNGQEDEETEKKLAEWTSAKRLINQDLIKWITHFDPTAGELHGGAERLNLYLKGNIKTFIHFCVAPNLSGLILEEGRITGPGYLPLISKTELFFALF